MSTTRSPARARLRESSGKTLNSNSRHSASQLYAFFVWGCDFVPIFAFVIASSSAARMPRRISRQLSTVAVQARDKALRDSTCVSIHVQCAMPVTGTAKLAAAVEKLVATGAGTRQRCRPIRRESQHDRGRSEDSKIPDLDFSLERRRAQYGLPRDDNIALACRP